MTIPPSSKKTGRRSFLKASAALAASAVLARLGLASAQGSSAAVKTAAAPPSVMELAISLEINAPSGFRYERPYVAVYIEDAQGRLVRTISLWTQTTQRGPRYLRELRRWFSASGGAALDPTTTSPTRNPGKYNLVWDGKTDKNVAAPQGEYYICAEAARQRGPYGLVREKVTLGGEALKKALNTSTSPDLASVVLDYHSKKA